MPSNCSLCHQTYGFVHSAYSLFPSAPGLFRFCTDIGPSPVIKFVKLLFEKGQVLVDNAKIKVLRSPLHSYGQWWCFWQLYHFVDVWPPNIGSWTQKDDHVRHNYWRIVATSEHILIIKLYYFHLLLNSVTYHGDLFLANKKMKIRKIKLK